jgi:hypothetical protein
LQKTPRYDKVKMKDATENHGRRTIALFLSGAAL